MTVGQRILQAILYADMFEHPMTQREIWRWIPTRIPLSKTQFRQTLHHLVYQNKLRLISPFLVLPNHTKYLGIHARRLMVSQKKWRIAYRVAKWIQMVPTVMFVGVTGSLAMNNAEDKDDIDFCIISSKGTVWITRFFTTILVELVAKRRHPQDREVKDRICLNMFLDEGALQMDASHQDVYIAHELLQMVPVWQRKDIQKRLLRTNSWVRLWYRHAYDEKLKRVVPRVTRKKRVEQILVWFERPVRWMQLQYMNQRRTKEEIGRRQIRFHPTDIRQHVITTYHSSLNAHKIPLDNQ